MATPMNASQKPRTDPSGLIQNRGVFSTVWARRTRFCTVATCFDSRLSDLRSSAGSGLTSSAAEVSTMLLRDALARSNRGPAEQVAMRKKAKC